MNTPPIFCFYAAVSFAPPPSLFALVVVVVVVVAAADFDWSGIAEKNYVA